MAPKTVRNRIYARHHPGWAPHSVYSPMSDGRIQVSDYVGGHFTHILTLQDGKTWADFYNAWTQGTHAGHTNAMSLVARKEERPDWNSDPVDTAPGSGLGKTLGKRVSFADQDSNSSSEGKGSKPVKKKKPKKEKPSD